MKKFCPFLLVVILFSMGSIAFAQNTSDVMLTTSSNQALSAFKTGLRFFDLGDNKKAREFFQQAIEQDPRFALAYVYRAFFSQSPQEFVANLNKAKENLAAANEWEKLIYEFAETDLTNNLDKRLEIAQKMVAQYPTTGRAFEMLGEVYDARKDFSK